MEVPLPRMVISALWMKHAPWQAAEKLGFVSGHDFTGCGKTKFLEGDGLQAVHK
jgi:hypothetical protein